MKFKQTEVYPWPKHVFEYLADVYCAQKDILKYGNCSGMPNLSIIEGRYTYNAYLDVVTKITLCD